MKRMLLIPVAIFVLTNCGSGEATNEGSTQPTTDGAASTTPASDGAQAPAEEEKLEAAVSSYSDAFLTGDSAAYDVLSKRCKARKSKEDFMLILDQAKATYGNAIDIKSFEAEISGDLARATYTYEISAINQDGEPWVKEGGDWKQDDC